MIEWGYSSTYEQIIHKFRGRKIYAARTREIASRYAAGTRPIIDPSSISRNHPQIVVAVTRGIDTDGKLAIMTSRDGRRIARTKIDSYTVTLIS
ncbi:hypothetical protein TM233_43790 [Bradyrhizobium sp. TM233]|nr:hypothetical protein TM233_43790 [Bradyrhizobium sp. TM233]